MSFSIPVIAIPAGKCPIKLKSIEYNDVVEWAEEVISVGRSKNVTYLPEALVFFAQQFFNFSSPDYKKVKETICSYYNSGGEIINLINKVNAASLIDKTQQAAEEGQPTKKRRGRPPKNKIGPILPKVAEPIIQKEENKPLEVKKKIIIKRK
jgi:hypothetical protein